MQARERPERDRRARERLVVAVPAKDGVDAGEAAGGAAHAVVGGDESLAQFVPCPRGAPSSVTRRAIPQFNGAPVRTHRVVRTGRRSG